MKKLLQFFQYLHLRDDYQKVSQKFHDLAHELAAQLPDNAEATTAIRKLLEAKDCAVRALVYKED